MSVYTDNGYTNRREYLENLASEYGVPTSVVFELASLLGSSEDFDGLVAALEDIDGEEFDGEDFE